MKRQVIAGLAVMLVASSAAASIVTPGSDYDAVDGAVEDFVKTISGCMNGGSAQVTALGGLKRQPSSAADGSQTVTIEFWRPTVTQLVNGVVWSTNNNFLGTKTFMTNSGDTTQYVTKTLSFTSSQITNTSTMISIVYMAPNVQVLATTVN